MVYGIIADLLGTLISGYVPLPIYMLTYPTIGLISGMFGYFYKINPYSKNKLLSISIIQLAILTLTIVPITIVNTSEEALLNSNVSKGLVYAATSISFLLLVVLIHYFINKEIKRNFKLFAYILFSSVLSRIIGQ
jgi:hypothetical protein